MKIKTLFFFVSILLVVSSSFVLAQQQQSNVQFSFYNTPDCSSDSLTATKSETTDTCLANDGTYSDPWKFYCYQGAIQVKVYKDKSCNNFWWMMYKYESVCYPMGPTKSYKIQCVNADNGNSATATLPAVSLPAITHHHRVGQFTFFSTNTCSSKTKPPQKTTETKNNSCTLEASWITGNSLAPRTFTCFDGGIQISFFSETDTTCSGKPVDTRLIYEKTCYFGGDTWANFSFVCVDPRIQPHQASKSKGHTTVAIIGVLCLAGILIVLVQKFFGKKKRLPPGFIPLGATTTTEHQNDFDNENEQNNNNNINHSDEEDDFGEENASPSAIQTETVSANRTTMQQIHSIIGTRVSNNEEGDTAMTTRD